MDIQRLSKIVFASVYPHCLAKAQKKGRKAAEVDEVICWLTGYTARTLKRQIDKKVDLQTFFADAPATHANAYMTPARSAACASRRSKTP
jgi:hypothetical protein